MARSARIQYPGALYHVMSRGSNKKQIFFNTSDYLMFLNLYKKTIENYNWISYAYCLMPNHYHLILKTIDSNLSAGMCNLNSNFAQKSNKKNKRVGHVFQGRYKSILVEEKKYLGELLRYITLNPVRANLVKSVEDWRWSSHGEIVGKMREMYTHTKNTLSVFHDDTIEARRLYKEYIDQKYNKKKFGKNLKRKIIIGSKQFINEVVKKYPIDNSKEVIKKQRMIGRPNLKEIFKNSTSYNERNFLIKIAFKKYGYTQAEIAKHLKMHYTSISRIINKRKCY